MTLAEIQTAMVATFNSKLPQLKTCEAHEGRFDANELKRVAGRCPALYVACLGLGQPVLSGTPFAPIRWGVFVVTKDAPKADRSTTALNLVQGVNVLLSEQSWGLEHARSDPERVSSQNLFGSATAGQGVMIWAVTWTQEFQLDDGVLWEELNDFLTAAGESATTDGAAITTKQTLPGASA
ncbi:phage protein Gp37 [Oceanobacter kriegii]|uniref:phage protein Gp37 n=1 Tax=Oceanobacter kriegii TaxID=64972 RepID=UPI0004209280|nr:phage protein Gp37 [Oceanobacter kriegii]